MKKRAMSRTKHTKKFVDKKTLFVIGAALFVVFAFLLTFVANNPQLSNSSSMTEAAITGAAVGSTNFISDFFTPWTSGNFDATIAKYLFWITIMLLIFSALKFANFPSFTKADGTSGGGFLQFLLALIVSFLATAFITPEEVFVMLVSYSALGLTLGSLLPFIVIIFFSAMLVSNERINQMSVAKMMLEVVIWFMWVGFLIYRFIKLWVEQGTLTVLWQGGGIVMLVVFFLSLIILIFNKKFRGWIQNLGTELIKAKERAISAGKQAEAESRRREHSAR
jgi:hypothetical protein